MSQLSANQPRLPAAPDQYDRRYQDQLNNVLRLFFNQITNPGDIGGASLNLNLNTLPTDADYDSLRFGDVYRDTQGGALQTGNNLLRIKVPVQLSGVQSVGAVGSVGTTKTMPLTGVSGTGAVGTVTP